ncbi:hypothetical protein HHL22_20495 [Hymenobacter sp. RP-2-7]|uniref:Uncharacterized protein n=1 Tax=Hymenobacter polaris TaxID=2682546 RepID=A0A7Y0FP22_9BACT|nr:hypothetical protein [Hymenobacter polaris]NML67587.1 hypothetical protein [Hymenobacter polaris]
MRTLYLLLLLTLAAWPSFGQRSLVDKLPTRPVCLTVPQQNQVRDSLLTLGALRVSIHQQQGAWRNASHLYNWALDSLDVAYRASQRGADSLRVAYDGSQRQLASQTQKTAMYRARAHRKGVVNALLSALLAGLLYSRFSSR